MTTFKNCIGVIWQKIDKNKGYKKHMLVRFKITLIGGALLMSIINAGFAFDISDTIYLHRCADGTYSGYCEEDPWPTAANPSTQSGTAVGTEADSSNDPTVVAGTEAAPSEKCRTQYHWFKRMRNLGCVMTSSGTELTGEQRSTKRLAWTTVAETAIVVGGVACASSGRSRSYSRVNPYTEIGARRNFGSTFKLNEKVM